MKGTLRWAAAAALLAAIVVGTPSAGAAGNPMKLVGALNPWKNGQFSNVAADANAFEFGTEAVFIVNILTGTVVGTYRSPEPQGCYPSDADCQQFNSPHDAWLQRSPAGHMLDYVAYWDSGMRIVDVTDPAHP